MPLNAPRGTKDILPVEVTAWRNIEAAARKIFSVYGYQEIRTPIFEQTGLFTRSLGETSEVVQKQLLTLISEDGTKDLSLRPEATAPIVRAYLESGLHKQSSFLKFYYIGPMFRGERPQKGRLRQFHHIGVEAIGATNPYLDVEVISLAVALLNNLGINGYTTKINNLGCPKDRKNFVDILKKSLKDKLPKLCENCQDRFERNPLRILDCKNENCRNAVSELSLDETLYLCNECRNYFKTVLAGLDSLKIPYEVSPYLVRGLDYYTKTVFEIIHPGLGSQDAIGAGGRYDTLVKELGGPETGAVGFAFGFERLILAMPAAESAAADSLDVYVVTLGARAQQQAVVITDALRTAGISCDTDYEQSSLKGQMRTADKHHVRFVIILGDNELDKNVVTLKNMTAGTQEEINQQTLIETLKAKL